MMRFARPMPCGEPGGSAPNGPRVRVPVTTRHQLRDSMSPVAPIVAPSSTTSRPASLRVAGLRGGARSVESNGSRLPEEGGGKPPPSPLRTPTLTAASTVLAVIRMARTQRDVRIATSADRAAREQRAAEHAERPAREPPLTVHCIRAVADDVAEAVGYLRRGGLRDRARQRDHRDCDCIAVLRHVTPPCVRVGRPWFRP